MNQSKVEMTREEWLATRNSTIGSSDIGAIIGVNDYATARDVFKVKTGLTPPFEGNDSTEWGTELEDFCALMFERKNPDFFTVGNVEAINKYRIQRDNKIRAMKNVPWATCNLDRLIVGDGSPVILELKTTTSWAVNSWETDIPKSYYAQLQWQLGVTGYKRAIIWVAVLDTKKFIRLDVEFNEDYFNAMFEIAQQFMDALIAKDIDVLPIVVKDTEGMVVTPGSTVEATEEIKDLVSRLIQKKDTISALEKEEKAMADELKVFIADKEQLVEGERVLATFGTYEKKGYTVAPSKYRKLDLKREKKEKTKKGGA